MILRFLEEKLLGFGFKRIDEIFRTCVKVKIDGGNYV